MNNTIDIIYTVLINDYSDLIAQTHLDSLWWKWEDAAKRVEELNKEFGEDDYCDMHSYYCEGVVK